MPKEPECRYCGETLAFGRGDEYPRLSWGDGMDSVWCPYGVQRHKAKLSLAKVRYWLNGLRAEYLNR